MVLSPALSIKRSEVVVPPVVLGDTKLKTRLALVVEYDGECYAGSQWQPEVLTIQSEIEKALYKLTGESARVTMAGRTDAGVHAAGQVVAFDTESSLEERAFVSGLNHFLPLDIAVKSARRMSLAFDPRRHASKREYEYFILNSATRSPLWNGRAHRIAGELNIDAMNHACQLLIGEHDFASFTSNTEDEERTTVRYMYHASARRDGRMVIVRMMASAFLLHQVRNTVGTLLRVGQGKMTLQEFQSIINTCEFGLAGPAVPSYGLYLKSVYYEEGF